MLLLLLQHTHPPSRKNRALRVGFFFYCMSRISYTKPPKTYSEQLQLLKNRGLTVNSDDKALHLLEKLSYYRLSGYWYPLLKEPKKAHIFKEGVDFQTAFRIYRFDRDLRIFILKELEKIEVAIRAQLIYQLSHHSGCFWFTDTTVFVNSMDHHNSLNKLSTEFKKSDEEFIKAFKKTYSDPFPPSWMMLEIASFGSLSKLYKNLKSGKTKRNIAHYFGLDDSTFSSWLHCFVYIRNVCAHHSRLWNRGMSISPQIPLNPSNNWLNNNNVNNNRSYFILSMMLYLLQSIDKKHQFIFRLKILLKKYPNIDVTAMGFPSNWENEPLWKFKPTFKQKLRLLLASSVK
jgi:abortive infection bacteriophage resistance protein